MSKPLSILITGGAGYLGSTMAPALLAEGYRVTVLDNFMFGQATLNQLCADSNFEVCRGDARDPDVLGPLLKDADIIIPLAALVGAPLCNNDKVGAETINRDAVLTILKLSSREQRVMMPVTNSGYGIGEPGKFCTEETPLRPISLYGRTKSKWSRRFWRAATASASAWQPSSACRRGCASTCWSMILYTAP